LSIWQGNCSWHGGRYEVNRDYDIFEKSPGGSSLWRGEMVVPSLELPQPFWY
jgi:hypothetical protein